MVRGPRSSLVTLFALAWLSVAGGACGGSSGTALQMDGGPLVGTLVASGSFEGRGGNTGRGGVRLVRREGGGFAVSFGADFSVSALPSPVVVLSTRADIGTQLSAGQGDLEVGPLVSANGAQDILFTADPGARRYVWVYCKPFGIEMARSLLQNAP